MEILVQCVFLILGFVMLVKGADWFVEGAAGVADYFGIPQLVIGLTIVAMGTSAPETAVSITAAFKGSADITIGNVVGSNILNTLIILGVTSCIVAVAVAKSTVKYEIPYMILVTFLLMLLGYTENVINFWEGVILWVAFLVYVAYLFVMAKNNREEVDEEAKQTAMWKLVLKAFDGLAFNVLFVVGTTALITPVQFDPAFMIDTMVAAMAGILLLVCVRKDQKLGRVGGTLMLLGYGGYFIYLMQ